MVRFRKSKDHIDNDMEEPLLTGAEGGKHTPSQQEQQRPAPPPVPFLGLFSHADALDAVMIALGALASIGVGIVMPLFSLVFGGILDAFYGPDPGSAVDRYSLYFVWLAIGSFLLNVVMSCCFAISSERQIRKMREHYLEAALRQEIAWFDTTQPGELATRIKGDTLVVQEGIGMKLARLIQFGAQFVAGFTIGFWRGWRLALVMMSILPLLAVAALVLVRSLVKAAARTQKRAAEAGAVAEEGIGNARTVAAFGGEKTQYARYADKLREARDSAIAAGARAGVMLGVILFIVFCSYAIGMAFGAYQVAQDIRHGCAGGGCTSGGDVLTVFWAVLQGAMSVGQCGPNLTALAEARGAAGHLKEVYERKPAIDASSTAGARPAATSGALELRNVTFRYPSRPEKTVLESASLKIDAGATVALVGPSGSGKSTIVGLVERFYDPESGAVLLDGRDVRELNVQWLRQRIGLVSQEPVLFSGSIEDNIRYGHEGATADDVVAAAKLANAHDFVSALPDGYATLVGEKGVQLSGGQKQRVAIARAVVRDPAVLLLDEATSALDAASERVVQAALDGLVAQRRRTTVIIAHRLSTIRGADSIVVLDGGAVVERGAHADLMARRDGRYAALVAAQVAGIGGGGGGGSRSSRTTSTGSSTASDSASAEAERRRLSSAAARARSYSSGSRAVSPRGSVEGTAAATGSPLSPAEAHALESSTAEVLRFQPLQGLPASPPRAEGALAPDPNPLAKDDGAEHRQQYELEKAAHADAAAPPPLPPRQATARLWRIAAPERRYFALALLSSTFSGAVFPVFALILSNIISFFYLTDADALQRKANVWSLAFVALALTVGVATAVNLYSYTVMGENLTARLKGQTFEAIMRQDAAFFDKEDNATGALTARLATETTLVKNIAGQNIGRMYQNVTTVLIAFLVAFVWGDWRLSAILAGVLPVLVLASVWQMRVIKGTSTKSQDSVAAAGALAVQALDCIRTVTAFGMSARILRMYHGLLQDPLRQGIKRGIIDGSILGLGQLIMLSAYGFTFWFGGHKVISGGVAFNRMLRSLMAIMMAAQGVGHTSPFFGDSAAARAAAARIFAVVDRRPAIDSSSPGGAQPAALSGSVELKGVTFRYPARPDLEVLTDLSLTIEAGTTVALVGASGSGKSTVVALLERFYDPERGAVLLDGRDLRELNVHWLRQQIGLVSQEPVLFSGTIAENIMYGREGASMDDVVAAARMANAHAFIAAFPDGYATRVGARGVQLSGGQKQRVAIARAVVRDPRVLLLDEATSALDAAAERVVQDALDRLVALRRRTTVVVAHRLSTIRGADVIHVLAGGRLVESGTHAQLIKANGSGGAGYYRALVEASTVG